MKELFLVEPQEGYKEGFLKMVEEYRAFGEKEYFDMYKEAISDFKGYVLKLNDNIGYDISPLSRKRGYGITLLKLALEKATMINLDKVLITCDDDNIASKRIIENNGGIFESKIFKEENKKELRRYWITLGV